MIILILKYGMICSGGYQINQELNHFKKAS